MMVEETSAVQYGRTRIEYGIRRSARRRTVSVAVDPVEGVLLTAPTHVAVQRLDRVVKDKGRWIVERLRAIENDTAPEPRRWVSGESILYLGRHYRLRVKPMARPGEPALVGGWLVVPVDRQLEGQKRSGAVAITVRGWYVAHAQRRLEARAQAWAAKAGVAMARVIVTDQQKRWASCDASGVLRFNWRIIQAPARLVDYVVAHEIVHLVHRDHTRAFWTRLGTIMPDYDRRKLDLRRLGPSLS